MIFSTFDGVGKVAKRGQRHAGRGRGRVQGVGCRLNPRRFGRGRSGGAAWAGACAVVATVVGWCSAYTNAAAATTTRTRQASTTVAVKTRLRSFCSCCFRARDLRVRRGTGLSAGVVSPASSHCAAASESMSGSASNGSIGGDSDRRHCRDCCGQRPRSGPLQARIPAAALGLAPALARTRPPVPRSRSDEEGCSLRLRLRLGCRRVRLHRPRRLFALELFFHLEVGQLVQVGLRLPLVVAAASSSLQAPIRLRPPSPPIGP